MRPGGRRGLMHDPCMIAIYWLIVAIINRALGRIVHENPVVDCLCLLIVDKLNFKLLLININDGTNKRNEWRPGQFKNSPICFLQRDQLTTMFRAADCRCSR